MKIEVEITERFLETCGTGTLVGTIMKIAGEVSFKDIKEVVLVFPQSSLVWRQEHNGPVQYIVTEYALPCLMEDIFTIQLCGIAVSMKYVIRNP